MWSSIVVGTDGSASAQEAVRRAAELATLCGSRLTLVSAYRPVNTAASLAMTGAGVGMAVDCSELLDQPRLEAEEVLEHSVMSLGTTISSPSTCALPGNAAEVLLQVAARLEADLIVVGNRGMQGGQRFLLGSIPNRVAHHASCSVLIAHTC